jgi:hypothetical protein
MSELNVNPQEYRDHSTFHRLKFVLRRFGYEDPLPIVTAFGEQNAQ